MPSAANSQNFDPRAVAAKVRCLGNRLSPSILEASQALYTAHHAREPYAGVRVERDLRYGSHERHRLDVFVAQGPTAAQPAPVLLFVHGGGFVGGDKKRPGTPYQDNIALWAVRQGIVGVNMTYRFAPEFTWPAGAEDVSAALAWLRANASRYGGNPERIFLMGTSAGAVHAASYVAHPGLHPGRGPGIAGAIFLSGLYDMASADRNDLLYVYFGRDEKEYGRRSSLNGLLDTKTPFMVTLAELDPPDFERQALKLVSAYHARHGHWPNFVRLMGHNHFTATLHFGTPDDYLGRQILDFMQV